MQIKRSSEHRAPTRHPVAHPSSAKKWLLPGLFFITGMLSANPPTQPDAYRSCIACHGDQAQGNDALNAPSLAGMTQDYLKRQLTHFQEKIRGSHPEDTLGAQMSAVSQSLNDEQIDSLSNYLSRLPAATTNDNSIDGSADKGGRYYQSNCGACHGPGGQGNPSLNAPRLTHLSGNYLLRQLSNFKEGIRGNHPKDTYGKQMVMMTKTLPDEQAMKDVIAYIHSVSP